MEGSKSYRLSIIKGELVIKKTFILLPTILLLTACSNKNIQLDEDNKIKDKNSLSASTLSYSDYKSAYESQNQKLKDRPHYKYEPTISKEEYEKLTFNDKEIKKVEEDNQSNFLQKKQSFMDFYSDWKNVRYKMGGSSRTGIDCSGFTQKVFKEKFGIELPRTIYSRSRSSTHFISYIFPIIIEIHKNLFFCNNTRCCR